MTNVERVLLGSQGCLDFPKRMPISWRSAPSKVKAGHKQKPSGLNYQYHHRNLGGCSHWS